MSASRPKPSSPGFAYAENGDLYSQGEPGVDELIKQTALSTFTATGRIGKPGAARSQLGSQTQWVGGKSEV